MRTCTLAFSIVVHLIAIALIAIAPIVATDTLPEPRRAFEFITVMPSPAPPAPQPIRRTSRSAVVNRSAAPVVAPAGVSKETGVEDNPADVGGVGAGVPNGIPDGIPGSTFVDIAPPPPPPAARPAPVRVGSSIRRPQKIRDVMPLYPAIARAAHVEGVVILEAVIDEDGRVRNLRVLRSIPLLDQAAIDAVRQWQFTPTLLNGEPVPIVMTVTVAFGLSR